ncbi:hypothetical protein YC2023_033653 [Brassica napus]
MVLDPISVNTLMGHNQGYGLQGVKPIANMRTRDRDFEEPEIAERLRRSREQPVQLFLGIG